MEAGPLNEGGRTVFKKFNVIFCIEKFFGDERWGAEVCNAVRNFPAVVVLAWARVPAWALAWAAGCGWLIWSNIVFKMYQ